MDTASKEASLTSPAFSERLHLSGLCDSEWIYHITTLCLCCFVILPLLDHEVLECQDCTLKVSPLLALVMPEMVFGTQKVLNEYSMNRWLISPPRAWETYLSSLICPAPALQGLRRPSCLSSPTRAARCRSTAVKKERPCVLLSVHFSENTLGHIPVLFMSGVPAPNLRSLNVWRWMSEWINERMP